MKTKKGFTLVELLAVIAILAILVIIALPNVLGMFQTARKNTFTQELQNIYKTAQEQFVVDQISHATDGATLVLGYGRNDGVICTKKSNPGKATYMGKLDLSGTTTLSYYIELDSSGRVNYFEANDGTYFYVNKTADLQIQGIIADDVMQIADTAPANVTDVTCE